MRTLLVDEIDNSGSTIKFCLEKLRKDNRAGSISICTLHNKNKDKKYDLAQYLPCPQYFCGNNIEDVWVHYPWDDQNPVDAVDVSTQVDAHDLVIGPAETEISADESLQDSPSWFETFRYDIGENNETDLDNRYARALNRLIPILGILCIFCKAVSWSRV